jgi:hypothetical protein
MFNSNAHDMLDEVMKEPAYILENGTPVPYLPVEVKTARDAYAASLHVLFKHVADFHLCIVRTFSTKYGIPEDEILQTIQESEEFKNMKVDPVLDTDQLDTLGYLQSTPTPVQAPTKEAPPPVKKIKAKKVIPAVVEPVAEPIVVVVVEDERHDTVPATSVATNVVASQESEQIKPKTIRKKVVQNPTTITAVNLFDTDTCATNVIAATLEAQIVATTPTITESEPIKIKTIRKKVVQKPALTPATEATNAVAPATEAPEATTADAPRKIIKKKTPIAAV